jgi:hypothetical protein
MYKNHFCHALGLERKNDSKIIDSEKFGNKTNWRKQYACFRQFYMTDLCLP